MKDGQVTFCYMSTHSHYCSAAFLRCFAFHPCDDPAPVPIWHPPLLSSSVPFLRSPPLTSPPPPVHGFYSSSSSYFSSYKRWVLYDRLRKIGSSENHIEMTLMAYHNTRAASII